MHIDGTKVIKRVSRVPVWRLLTCMEIEMFGSNFNKYTESLQVIKMVRISSIDTKIANAIEPYFVFQLIFQFVKLF